MAARKTSKSSKKHNGSLLTTGVIVLAFLVLIVIFLVNKDTIFTNFKETHFFDRIFGSTPEFVQNYKPEKKEQKQELPEEDNEPVVISVTPEEKISSEKSEEKNPVEIKKSEPAKVEEKSSEKAETKKESEKATSKSETKKEEIKPAVQMTNYELCFVILDSEGGVSRKMVKRSVPKNDSPLTTAINLVIKGPDASNSAEKYARSYIPSGTKLLGARVKDGIAYLNFSQDFEINPNGIEGYQAQLMQIVYTATAFSTVNSVQFMIEGEERPYLSEAIWIGSPLTRNSFN